MTGLVSTKSCAARLAAFAGAVLLSACGFHPLYGTESAGSELSNTFAAIYVEPIADFGVANTGYELRNALINDLDSNQGARYRLKLSLTETTQGIALETDASITRYNDTLTVDYALTDNETGNVIKQGEETGLSAYNVTSNPYSTLIAQQAADKRAAQDMAERLRLELGAFFDQRSARR